MRAAGAILFAAGVSLCGAAIAQTPRDLRDLVGARAAGGERQLESRGYVNVGAQQGDDRVWTTWWNPRTRSCITVSTVQGRYDAITTSPAPDCDQYAGQQGNGRPTTLPAGPMRPIDVPSRPSDNWFELGLVCFGEGQRPQLGTRYGYSWDYDKGRYTYGNRSELTTEDFDASVNVQLWEGGGRIRLPKKLIPPIHSRGDHGWWELDAVNTNRNTITAEYRLNGLNKPKLTIDRRSGRISIRGAADYAFSGTCDTVDSQARRF